MRSLTTAPSVVLKYKNIMTFLRIHIPVNQYNTIRHVADRIVA
jgi:hypothetical protein